MPLIDAADDFAVANAVCCSALGRDWHKADMPVVPLNVGFLGECVTAKALGLDLPASVLARADEMIE